MESKHLVGGIGKTTTGEQVTVIVYPYRLPKRLNPLTECILETQKNFGNEAIARCCCSASTRKPSSSW